MKFFIKIARKYLLPAVVILLSIFALDVFHASGLPGIVQVQAQSNPIESGKDSNNLPEEPDKPRDSQVLEEVNKPAQFHRVQMRLSGSMCFSCLHTLEKKIKEQAGVQQVKIERSPFTWYQSYSPDLSVWAEAFVVYDSSKISLSQLRMFIRNHGYLSYKIVDKYIDNPFSTAK